MMATGLPLQDFPPARTDASSRAAALAAQDLRLRPATRHDLPFLRELYGALRADELAQTGWPDSLQRAFLDSQFALQHHHFVTVYANADFYIVHAGEETIGRYYLLRQSPNYLIVDIALLPAWRGRGIGTTLLSRTQRLVKDDEAASAGIDLHVDERNVGAQRLYARLGFQLTEHQSPYFGMHWSHAAAAQLNTA